MYTHIHCQPLVLYTPDLSSCAQPPPFYLLLPQYARIKYHPLPQPRRPLGMVPLLVRIFPSYGVNGVGMQQGTERATVDDEPGNEGTELCWREDVHLEHGHWVRPNGLIPELVDAQLGDCGTGLLVKKLQHSVWEVLLQKWAAYIPFLSSPIAHRQTSFGWRCSGSNRCGRR